MGAVYDFFRTAIRDMGHIGAFMPSTRYVCRTVASKVPAQSRCVVEYGPGDGVITKLLTDKLCEGGKVIGVEINDVFAKRLSEELNDPRVEIVHGDIRTISKELHSWASDGVDAVVSGIPFTFLSKQERQDVVANTYRGLRPGGVFVVYQYTPRMLSVLNREFDWVERDFELRNLPPYYLMIGRKKADVDSATKPVKCTNM